MVALPAKPIAVPTQHPWRLVAPWWRWARAAHPADGRVTAPTLHKFAGAAFIPGFLADPQHSLVFDPDVDVVSTVDLLPAAAGGALVAKLGALFATKPDGTPVKPTDTAAILTSLRRTRLVPSGLRKLYQPIHDRHYLVATELHCDVPGFPTASRSDVCEQGFVVRRRQRVVPAPLQGEAASRAATLRGAEVALAELREASPLRGDLAAARRAQIEALRQVGTLDAAIAAARATVDAQRAALDGWFAANGIFVQVEGWHPAGGTLGAWVPLVDPHGDPHAEEVHPLYPLVPDPREPKHDLAGRTLFYGAVPTASLAHDAAGRPRLDDAHTYEIRCFVRRHRCGCPRTGRVPDCHGEVVWSAATEPYRVAAPFDPVGSANRPITIKMPDLRELAAQVMARPRGAQSPVRFVQPQHLSPKVADGKVDGGEMRGNAICFFSIPLITIIALFVLNLFLPIVVFIFQLWFLLVFRFCIPPSVKFDAALDAKLAATPPSVDLDADFAISIDGVTMASAAQLNAAMAANLRGKVQTEHGEDPGSGFNAFGNNALRSMQDSLADNAAVQPGPDPETPPAVRDYASGLVWEVRREKQWQPVGGRG